MTVIGHLFVASVRVAGIEVLFVAGQYCLRLIQYIVISSQPRRLSRLLPLTSSVCLLVLLFTPQVSHGVKPIGIQLIKRAEGRHSRRHCQRSGNGVVGAQPSE